jgi:hypothetical protein
MIHILLDADLDLYSRQDFLGTLNPLIRDKATRVCKKKCATVQRVVDCV